MISRRGAVQAFTVTAASVILDQVSKRLVIGSLDPAEPVPILGGFIRLVLRYNEGAAFSFSWGGPMVLTVLSAAAAVLITIFIFRCSRCSGLTFAALGAVLGGALGNLIDRIFSGRVIDFIDVGVSGWRWPTFNVADISIVAGGLALLIFYRSRGTDGDSGGEE